MAATAEALAYPVIRRFEGLELKPYLCPASVWTIGYGATVAPDGGPVTRDTPAIDKAQAEALLARDVSRMARHVSRLVAVPMSAGQRAALIDFTFNLGPTNLRSSTLLRRVNAGEWDDVPHQFRRWVNGGGVRLPGLVLRREMDVELWLRELEGLLNDEAPPSGGAPPLPTPRPDQRPGSSTAVPATVETRPTRPITSGVWGWLRSLL